MLPGPSSSAGGGRDPRTLRLYDLSPWEAIIVRCACGRMSEYGPGLLQRLHRLPSGTLIFDLQARLRCQHYNRRNGFDIGALDIRPCSDGRRAPMERQTVTWQR